MASAASIPYTASSDNLDYEDKSCGGCRRPVDDGDGVVVAFGNALWHVDCFNCAKCGNRVSPDTNLLLLSDGSPVCASCSYNCAVCKKPISHEAIMTGDESYHAACFACKTCGRHIGELVFAKTTQGIYCMACHNERVARSRRHAEQRKNRNKASNGRDRDKDKLREKPSISHIRGNECSSSIQVTTPETPLSPGPNSSQIAHADSAISQAAKRVSTQSATLRQYSDCTSPRRPLAPIKAAPQTPRSSSPLPSPSIMTTHASPPSSMGGNTSYERSLYQEDDTLALPRSPVESGPRRKSFDDGVRPLQTLLENASSMNRPSSSAGTTLDLQAAPRSPIMPGSPLDWARGASTESQHRLSPSLLSPTADNRQLTSGSSNQSRDSAERSRSPSPLRRGSPYPLSPGIGTSSPQSSSLPSPTYPQRHQTDPFITQDRDFPTRMQSLPDTSSTSHHHPTVQTPLSTSGHIKIAYDLDDYLTTTPPGRRSLDSTKMPDNGNRLAQRPGSAGLLSSREPPSPVTPLSRARSSSVNASPLTAELTVTTPTRAVSNPAPVVTVTNSSASSNRTARPGATGKQDSTELVAKRIKDALADALMTGDTTVKFDREFVEVLFLAVHSNREKLHEMRDKFDGMRRASKHYIDGISVAQDEYDNEVAARREAEAEVTRLKVQLSGQAARLTELSAGERKRDIVEQISRDISENLHSLERDLSKLKAERDLTAAEVEELVLVKGYIASAPAEGTTAQRSLTKRFDNIKTQYKRELAPLVQQREALLREINELKEERNICLEETTALNARNEELAALIAQMSRQMEAGAHISNLRPWQQAAQSQPLVPMMSKNLPTVPQFNQFNPVASTSSNGSTIIIEDREEPRVMVTPNSGKKWFKPSKETFRPLTDGERETIKHNFQLLTVLRFARCDHCGDKMWGTQLRCTTCNIACHNRCVGQIPLACSNEPRLREDAVNVGPLPPSMFGRDLIEQVRADSAREHRDIPIIVEKCIAAVEHLAMDYEGIYRKTGGSSQSKAITQLFERGNYDAFDLRNSDAFNDISSITSVLKTYFRQLPNPLLTHALHDAFSTAAVIRDQRAKAESLSSLVYQLPSEHFHTLRFLMLHLYRVQLRAKDNLMTARNLGVVFGPTLMRASDPSREFADMAGKALAIEWLVENAPIVFREQEDI
ncbi:signal transducer [Hysterangium stoloniferum]|nr:signal transducer [Hysterangium stoloniferum]